MSENAKAPKAKKATVKVPNDGQRAVLDVLSGGRIARIVDNGGKKSVNLTTAKGGAVKDAPKVNRAALEACMKNGWVCPNAGTLTDDGKKAKKAKSKTAVAA